MNTFGFWSAWKPAPAGLALLAASLAPAAAAQESVGTLIDEITVTAQRRDESAQRVPVAITAYSADQLAQLNVTEALDMTHLVPNLVGHNNTGLGTANTYSLRALGNTESIATFDPPVGTYVDDVYVARQNANNFALFDVDRIEVLRGPQGTLFGRNTTGGVVRVILKKPAEEMGGYVEAGYGEFDRFATRASIDMPVSEQLLTKLSGYWIEDDGFVRSTTTGEDDLNSQSSFGVRGHVLWRVTEAVDWDVALDYIEDDHANMLNFKDGSDRISHTGLPQSGSPLAGIFTGEKQYYPLGNEVTTFSVNSTIAWSGDFGTVRFITGLRNLDQEFALDFFDGPASYGGFTIANRGEHDQLTQEITWAGSLGERFDVVAGVYYFDEDNTTDFADLFDIGFPLVLADRVLENETEAWAAYLQADYHLTDQWTATVGVRFTDEEKTVRFSDSQPAGDETDLTSANMVLNGIPLEISQDLWTPRFVLSWQPGDDQTYFVSATRGFKSGGWNARGYSPDLLQPFRSEIVWSYELGMKSRWWDDRLQLNLTAFMSDVSDFQLPTAFPAAGGGVAFITRNFADLDVKGIEGEVIVAPTDALTLYVNFGIQDASYENLDPSIIAQQAECLEDDTNCGTGIVTANGEIATPTRAPEYTVNAGFNYRWALGGAYELVPAANIYSVGENWVEASGSPPGAVVDPYTAVNAGVTLDNIEGDWRVTLECKNCTDRTIVHSGLAGFLYIDDPLTWQLTLRKGFGTD